MKTKRPAIPNGPQDVFVILKNVLQTRTELREQDHVTDRIGAGQKHDQTVDAHSHASGRRHAVFQRGKEIFVNGLCRILESVT